MGSQDGLFDISGVVGLSTGLSRFSDGDLIINKLYSAGVIESPVFGFYLAGTDSQSFLDIGGLVPSAMRNPEELVWLDTMKDDFWWTSPITNAEVVSKDNSI